jgi:hypothetical protein
MAGAFALSGCSGFRDSRINPRNWFGRSTSQPRTAAASTAAGGNPLIPEREDSIFRRAPRVVVYEGTPVDQVTDLSIEPTSDGAIISVTGQTLRQGAFDVRLVPEQPADAPVAGVLSYELRALQPTDTPQGPPRTRQVNAGVFVSNEDISRVTRVRVRGLRNERVSSL